MQYYRPDSLIDLLGLTASLPAAGTRLLAGGTDLMPRFEKAGILPHHLVDLKNLPDLTGIRATVRGLEIGALVTVAELAAHPRVQSEYPALKEAAHQFAGVQIRHRATIGGNICNASPAADLVTPLIAMNALLVLSKSEDSRTMPLSMFATGPGTTRIQPNEVLVKVILPPPTGESIFFKIGLRQAMAVSVVNLAIQYRFSQGKFTELSLAAGAVAPTVVRLQNTRSALMNQPDKPETALNNLDDDITPITDVRATAAYRKQVLRNLLQHAVNHITREKCD